MKNPSILSVLNNFKKLLSKKQKLQFLLIFVFAITVSFLELLSTFSIVTFANILTNPESGFYYLKKLHLDLTLNSKEILTYCSILCCSIYLVKNLFSACSIFTQNYFINFMDFDFKEKLLKKYSKMDYKLYITRNSVYGVDVVNHDIEQTFSIGMRALASGVSEFFIIFFLLSLSIYVNSTIAISLLSFSILFTVFYTYFFFPLFYKIGKNLQETRNLSNKHLFQFFHAFKEVTLLNKTSAFINYYQNFSKKHTKIKILQFTLLDLPRLLIESLFMFSFVFIIWFMNRINSPTEEIISVLGSYFYIGFRIIPAGNRLFGNSQSFKCVLPHIERIYEEYFLINEKSNYLNLPDFTCFEKITFSNVSFKYLNSDINSLKNISLEIKKGQSIGIIGKTGSGKSTLIDCLLGILKPSNGKVLINRIHLPHSKQWHQKIGYVPQSIYLTDNTIEENIVFGEKPENINYDQLHSAINNAQLSTLIKKLPEGLKTVIGERGIRLSGGEKQRIIIARTLYLLPEVLIFDEATSALDNKTENDVMKTINNLKKTHTLIMVAHRLTTLKDCDYIFHMKNGEIINKTNYKEISTNINIASPQLVNA